MAYFDNITLEKEMYNSEKSFSQVLESLDPSANYRGSEIEGLDAFERQLKRFDIKVSGAGSDMVAKFFQNTKSATLFPEYVKRCVVAGMTENSHLDSIIAATTSINTTDYRPIAVSAPKSGDTVGNFAVTAPGAELAVTEIKPQNSLVALKKRGRLLNTAYEAVKFQRLELFAVALKQMGAFIAKSQLSDAVSTIISGDGNGNAAKSITVATTGTLTYADLVKLWGEFVNYNMNRLLIAPDVMAQLLKLNELKDPAAGLKFQGTSRLITPFGAEVISTAAVPAGKLIALDKDCALEMIICGDISVESDKLINQQLDRTAITSTAGFAKIFSDAAVCMTV